LKEKIKQLKPELQTITNQINEVNKVMNDVSTYNIDKLIEVVHKVNNMSDNDKKLMTDLINLTQVK
jgi:archaellum component FlaC